MAARVRTPEGEEQWILAEVFAFNPSTNKYPLEPLFTSSSANLLHRFVSWVDLPCNFFLRSSMKIVIPWQLLITVR